MKKKKKEFQEDRRKWSTLEWVTELQEIWEIENAYEA